MHVLVVFDSTYGNTEALARAVAHHFSVEPVAVTAAPDLAGVDLLIIGSPTHGHRESEPMGHWVAGLPRLGGVGVALFDTRHELPRWMTGSAARALAPRLRALGSHEVVPPQSFYVARGVAGPLLVGELERADRWAEHVAQRFSAWRVARPAA